LGRTGGSWSQLAQAAPTAASLEVEDAVLRLLGAVVEALIVTPALACW
jgi:hypothetical protein